MTLTELLEQAKKAETPEQIESAAPARRPGQMRCPECKKFAMYEAIEEFGTCLDCCPGWQERRARRAASASRPRAAARRGACASPDRHRAPDERPHVLYRFFDAAGALLYVGITVNLRQRLCEHFGPYNGGKEWERVANVTLQHYPNREAVQSAEAVAIATECPAWNAIRYKRRARERAKATS